jgi:hypothetical protein
MMYAEILAIGPFRHDFVRFYEYPEIYYSKTLPGTCIVTHLFGISEGTSLSCEFARFLGIDDAWDFNQHKIELTKIDTEGFRVFLQTLSAWEEDHSRDLEALVAFVNAGYDLYFLPNG